MREKKSKQQVRISWIAVFLCIICMAIVYRLFVLQILTFDYYTALASNTHEIYKQLFPKRGNIYIQDSRSDFNNEYPVAVQRPYYLVYAVPLEIDSSEAASTTALLAGILNYDKEQADLLLDRLLKNNDPYEVVEKKVFDDVVEKINKLGLKGIYYISKDHRYYPENCLVSSLVGFVGSDTNGNLAGRYGIESAWEKELAGTSGFLIGTKGAQGSIISAASKTLQKSEDGPDLLLTIDRSIQYQACETLRNGFVEYKAKSASLIILDSQTGAILAMCSLPDYDPNNYSQEKNASVFNNNTVEAYEPGSVFKPITMAIGLDLNLVNPDTLFTDPGVRIISGYKVHNAMEKKYGTVTMTQVLENSINTGVIWVQEKIGESRFKNYIERFGFGKKTGIKISGESAGNISSLSKNAPIYGANASFGQGFTVTPLQLATAYTALANNGKLMKPYVIEEIRYKNGKTEKIRPQVVETVISERTQKLITGMMISVVEKGNGYVAVKMDDYYIAGKTGTAQIASLQGGYSEESNHTFVGFFPAKQPRFVMVVKYEAPARQWAESTAAPTFKKVADFTLKYYGIAGDK
ncbi:MAG: penicillin-binding protein 2 [bacterium]